MTVELFTEVLCYMLRIRLKAYTSICQRSHMWVSSQPIKCRLYYKRRDTKCYRGFRTSPRVRKGNFLDRLKVKLRLASAKHLSRIISYKAFTNLAMSIKEKVQSTQIYLCLHRVSKTSASILTNSFSDRSCNLFLKIETR